MSKYTVSQLSTTEEIGDNDLFLISKKNEDGTYSSVNVSLSTLASAVVPDTNSNSGNGTTDTINLFLPTTAFKTVSSKFYIATGEATLHSDTEGWFIGDEDPTYKGKAAGDPDVRKWEKVETKIWTLHAISNGYVVQSDPEESGKDVDRPAGDCYKYEKVGEDWKKSTTEKWSKLDIETEAGLLFLKTAAIADSTYSTQLEAIEKRDEKCVSFLLNEIDFTITSRSEETVQRSKTDPWKLVDIGTELFNRYVKVRKQVDDLTCGVMDITANRTKMSEKYLILLPLIVVQYQSSATSESQVAYASNTIVFSEELIIKEDSAVYIYGSFTCSATGNQGQSYYVEIQMQCDSGDDDVDKNWYPIFRKYMDMSNLNYRSSFNYQLYAKAGVKIRGMIAPFGNSGLIYYNLSEFCFTQCKLTGSFIEGSEQKALQIPYNNFASTKYIIGQNGVVDFKGCFSYTGNYANLDHDRTTNLYFVNNGRNLHTMGITTRSAEYSSYKYFVKKNDSLGFITSNNAGNNAYYPPYGPNTGVITFSPVDYDIDDVKHLAENGSKLKYRVDLTTDRYLGNSNYRNRYLWWFWWPIYWGCYYVGGKGLHLTHPFNHSYYPSARIGIYKIGINSDYQVEIDGDNKTGASLWIKWPMYSKEEYDLSGSSLDPLNAYEIGDGATSLYYCTGNPTHQCSGTYYAEFLNNLTSLQFSDAKNHAAQYSSKNLVDIERLGSNVHTFDDYCCYDCTNLSNVTASLSSITYVGQYAFSQCKNLLTPMNFNTTSSMTIGNYAFYRCSKLPGLTASTATNLGEYVCYEDIELTSLRADEATYIGKYAFSGRNLNYAPKLVEVKLPKAKNIEFRAFKFCKMLTTVDLPSAIAIGQESFYNCTTLTSVNIPNATIVGINAFNSSKNIKTVKANKLIEINNAAFNLAENCVFDFTELGILFPSLKSTNAFPNPGNKNMLWKITLKDEDAYNSWTHATNWSKFCPKPNTVDDPPAGAYDRFEYTRPDGTKKRAYVKNGKEVIYL